MNKGFIKSRLITEFANFTKFLFGSTQSPGQSAQFADGLSGAIDDYTNARVLPIEQKNTQQDQQIAVLNARVTALESQLGALSNVIQAS